MLIEVVFTNQHHDYVKAFMLDSLIDAQRIARFRRSTGWVTIGKDRVRDVKSKRTFDGIEKRSAIAALYPITIEVAE